MNCIVTGGAGFIGSHITDLLLAQGYTVTVIDNFVAGKRENLQQHKRLTIVERSVCEPLDDIFSKGIDVVFHLAALPEVQYSIQHPEETHDVNVNGTLNILLHMKKHGVKRLIFTSSSSVYGDQDRLPFTEDMKPNPLSPYALHKLIGEHYCSLFHFLYGLEIIALRYFNVYGPRQNAQSNYACLVPKFFLKLASNEVPTIFGDGEQTRDYVYVGDVAQANLRAALTTNKNCFGKAYNIGGGKNVSINAISDQIVSLTGAAIRPVHGPAVIEPRNGLSDISRAERDLGWKPTVPLEEGLRLTGEFFIEKARSSSRLR